jgi:hypothetical protein
VSVVHVGKRKLSVILIFVKYKYLWIVVILMQNVLNAANFPECWNDQFSP